MRVMDAYKFLNGLDTEVTWVDGIGNKFMCGSWKVRQFENKTSKNKLRCLVSVE